MPLPTAVYSLQFKVSRVSSEFSTKEIIVHYEGNPVKIQPITKQVTKISIKFIPLAWTEKTPAIRVLFRELCEIKFAHILSL